jgi:hypothetical protein
MELLDIALMRRRVFLGGTGSLASLCIAGCSESESVDESLTPKDSDGDGIPDKDDYAPRDSDVQSKSDMITETPSRTRTSTNTEIVTPTPTPNSTPTGVTGDSKTIQADNGRLKEVTHHPIEYSNSHTKVRIYGDLLENDYPDGAQLVTYVQGYPDTSQSDRTIISTRSDIFSPSTGGETTINVEFGESVSASVPIYYWFILTPAGEELSSLSGEDVDYIGQTDRLRTEPGELNRAPHQDLPSDDINTNRYKRNAAEGCYLLEFSGTSYRSNWGANLTVYKHGYIKDINGQRYNDRRQFIYEAINRGLANEFGNILNDEAKANGITGGREKVEFLIDFVQNLPYIPDDVSTGYDDYSKRLTETLVDGGGDCEDSSIMLASLLSSEPFGYGTALLLPPKHAAIGVKGGNDISGYYYEYEGTRYYYIESTGRGWNVGEIPDEYRGKEATILPI